MTHLLKHLLIGLMACGLIAACDDGDGGGGGGTPDMGGGGGEGGGGVATTETYLFTSLQMTEPAAAANILNGALTTNLNNGSLIVLVQMEDWAGGMPILRGGAGQLVEGADTPDDISDDVFDWLTEGVCSDADGNEVACSVEISEKAGARSGDDFTLEGGEIAIYAKDLKLIIPIKDLALDGTRAGIEVTAQLRGVITQADAQDTRFQLTPGGPVQVLDTLLMTLGVMPDTTFEGAPAYTFAGSFGSELIVFAGQ